jgi:hypothetical protein
MQNLKQELRLAVLAALAPFAFAQTAPRQFEVASVKQVQPGEARVDLGYHIDGQMVSCNALSLKDYIRLAWQVKDYQIVGPEYLAENRFDLRAKLPEGAKGDDIREGVSGLCAGAGERRIEASGVRAGFAGRGRREACHQRPGERQLAGREPQPGPRLVLHVLE